jgi:CHAT domain-containing protein/Tfp pilus assembly protein PilF
VAGQLAPMAAIPTRRRRRSRFRAWTAALVAIALSGCGREPSELERANVLERTGRADAALHVVESALAGGKRSSGEHWELALRKAQLLSRLDRRPEARAWIQSLKLDAAPAGTRILFTREEASIEASLGHFREADALLAQALQTAHATGQAAMEANLEVRRSRILYKLGELDAAEKCLNRAEASAHARADNSLDPFIHHNRGLVLAASNRFEEALAPLQRSLAEFRARDRLADAANVLISIAWCHLGLGQFDKARQLYNDALAIAAPADRHLCVGHLGNVFYKERQFTQAAESYRRAAELAKDVDQDYYSLWLTNLAGSLLEQGKFQEAETVNDEALELERRLDHSLGLEHSLVNEGMIEFGKGNPAGAERLLRNVLSSPDTNLSAKLDAGSSLAKVLVAEGKIHDAKRQFEDTLNLAKATRLDLRDDENKLTFLAALISLDQEYVRFLMSHESPGDALVVAESLRARVLRERLNRHGESAPRLTVQDYRAAARAAGTVFLVYWVAPDQSYLWTISPSALTVHSLPGADRIRALIERYQSAIDSAGRNRARIGAELSQLLLGPVQSLLRAGGQYLIVPDGPLCALNFETLPPPGGDPSRFWIRDATLSVAPSLNLLLAKRTAPIRTRSVLALGDAIEWNPDFPKLINAGKEIQSIERAFPAHMTALTAAAATPVAYQQAHPGDYEYLHFAAHATANRDAPFESAIILSPANGNGRLSVRDVLRTPLRADLVTISACRSAGARTYAGEGLVGLAWAFLQSGARQVIAGLWNVNDYASAKLMDGLYKGLAARCPPAEALRAAKLKLMSEGRLADPFDWGALQVYTGVLPPASARR